MKFYGNYYGNKHSNWDVPPIDGIDFVTFMHDIDHKICSPNNRFADRVLRDRMRHALKHDEAIPLLGRFMAYLAIYVYSMFYASFFRESFFGKLLEKKGIFRTSEEESSKFYCNQNKCIQFAIETIRKWNVSQDRKQMYVMLYGVLFDIPVPK